MTHLPEIANLPLQTLQVPGGWRVIINHFYEIDPDDDLAGRQILHLDPARIIDPWDDVLLYYFDHSSLWYATRNDGRYYLDLEWSPMGQRDGHFIIRQYHAQPIMFSHPPKRTLKQKRDNIEISYELTPPVIWPDSSERVFESRDRKQIVSTLNQWLCECSRSWY